MNRIRKLIEQPLFDCSFHLALSCFKASSQAKQKHPENTTFALNIMVNKWETSVTKVTSNIPSNEGAQARISLYLSDDVSATEGQHLCVILYV